VLVLEDVMIGLRRRKATSLKLVFIVALACTCGCVNRGKDALRSREAMLKEDLYLMRNSIDQYTQEKNAAPQDLQALVHAGYMQAIPKDPITNSTETWQVERDDVMTSLDHTQPGITDVHSGSAQISSEGTPYSRW
jgi:iron only hydrogenase large subunit-like protein